MQDIPQLVVSTILLGGVYALIAVGRTLIFGVMRVVNFAYGEFLMLAMYLAFFAFALLGLDPYLTLVLAFPLFLGLGWLSYRVVMRPVLLRPPLRLSGVRRLFSGLLFVISSNDGRFL